MKYALDRGGPKRLEIAWTGNWKDFTVKVDGLLVGSFADVDELKTGREFLLADGSHLKVQLAGKSVFTIPQILRNGEPLPTPGPPPAKHLRFIYSFIFLIGVANLVAGLGLLSNARLPLVGVAGPLSVILGVLSLVLGFLVMRRVKAALAVFICIYFLDAFIVLAFRPDIPRLFRVLVVGFRLLILICFLSGFGAIDAVNRSKAGKDLPAAGPNPPM